MAYDERLAARIRDVLGPGVEVVEKRMFGGLAFMVGGHMCCGVLGDTLLVRIGAEAHSEALARPHTRVMDFTGRPSKGMIYVDAAGVKTTKALHAWIGRALAHVAALRAPKTKPREKARRRS
jgi:TfoX/Sxy family transcriptional regulator of competence genes